MTTKQLKLSLDLEVLEYAIEICQLSKSNLKKDGWNAACENIECFLQAAKERLQMGLDLRDYAVTQ